MTTKLYMNNRWMLVNNRGDLGRLPFTFWADLYLDYTFKISGRYRGLHQPPDQQRHQHQNDPEQDHHPEPGRDLRVQRRDPGRDARQHLPADDRGRGRCEHRLRPVGDPVRPLVRPPGRQVLVLIGDAQALTFDNKGPLPEGGRAFFLTISGNPLIWNINGHDENRRISAKKRPDPAGSGGRSRAAGDACSRSSGVSSSCWALVAAALSDSSRDGPPSDRGPPPLPTSSSSPWTRPGPITSAATASPRPRPPTSTAWPARAIRFARVYAPAPLTLPSHSSIMTGLYPATHGVRNNGHELAREVEDAGRDPEGPRLRHGGLRLVVLGRLPLRPRPGLRCLRRHLPAAGAPQRARTPSAGPRRRSPGSPAGSTATARTGSSPGSITTTRTCPTTRRRPIGKDSPAVPTTARSPTWTITSAPSSTALEAKGLRGQDPRRRRRRPRRRPGGQGGDRPRHLPLRRDPARAPHHPATAGLSPPPGRRERGPAGRRGPDHPGDARPQGRRRPAWRARASSPGSRARPGGPRRPRRDLLPAGELRLVRARRHRLRALEIHPGAPARALRPGERPAARRPDLAAASAGQGRRAAREARSRSSFA